MIEPLQIHFLGLRLYFLIKPFDLCHCTDQVNMCRQSLEYDGWVGLAKYVTFASLQIVCQCQKEISGSMEINFV